MRRRPRRPGAAVAGVLDVGVFPNRVRCRRRALHTRLDARGARAHVGLPPAPSLPIPCLPVVSGPSPASAALAALAARWSSAKPHERGSAQPYLSELCTALGVTPPGVPGSGYEFEFTIDAITVEGKESKNFIDLWKTGHFALEAKDHEPQRSNDLLLRRAFGQVRNYVAHTPGDPPPYIMVLDVARTLVVWDRWSGSYGGYAAGRRIDLPTLAERPEDVALLRDIWERPASRDPHARAQAVTTELAGRLAQLAASLEGRGHSQERVARFLMRVVFSCFAEDIGLLPNDAFRQTVTEAGLRGTPEQFTEAVTALWRAMDGGGMYGFLRLLRFNGHFFRDAEALPLTREELVLLKEAAQADWSRVEPTIFGTLLVRALDPEERHQLGAEYTPRAHIERLIRPTVEEPIRERWTAVQAEVLQLRESARPRDRTAAAGKIASFHDWLRSLLVLDPACGSGNFLYVTMHAMKRIELEVLRELDAVVGQGALRLEEIGPWQFYGIEKKAWAREIAELVLWIGFHQFWREHHHVQPDEPILRDTGTLDWRDAVLTWQRTREDPARDTYDPTPRLVHPVTGRLVPDPDARRPYIVFEGAGPAAWPAADFIVGNPPYIGAKRMREALTDGYVDALRAAYPSIADSADYVAFWWHKAAAAVASGQTIRAGLITTNSITQVHQRAIITEAREHGAVVVWAVPDHPWVDDADGAAVRVALTVVAQPTGSATYVEVDDAGQVTRTLRVPALNDDLTPHADVASATDDPLLSNAGIASMGFALHGHGFIVPGDEARPLLAADPALAAALRPFAAGRDLTQRPRDLYVIDFGYLSEDAARAWPVLYDRVADRVKPERLANRRETLRRHWWRFGWPRRELRDALTGLPRYIVTTETAKHRFFTFLSATVAPDHSLVCIASADPFVLGVLSSSIHAVWALAAGSTLEDRPRYTKTACFDPFPFPVPPPALREQIGELATAIVAHRARAVATHPAATPTALYNVVAKLREGTPLTMAERALHEATACGTLRDMHDRLDAAVAAAYGWSWPESPAVVLERLVALHAERRREEATGQVRWLRPDYQPGRAGAIAAGDAEAAAVLEASAVEPLEWPTNAAGQIMLVQRLVAEGPLTVEEAMARVPRARREMLLRHLETLVLLGEVQRTGDSTYAPAPAFV